MKGILQKDFDHIIEQYRHEIVMPTDILYELEKRLIKNIDNEFMEFAKQPKIIKEWGNNALNAVTRDFATKIVGDGEI